jgi:hypothetical protein
MQLNTSLTHQVVFCAAIYFGLCLSSATGVNVFDDVLEPLCVKWSGRLDSNQRPSGSKPDALPD